MRAPNPAPAMFGVLLLLGLMLPLRAQEARFFRVAGPVPATITETTPAGLITWTNLPTNGTFTVQTATFLEGGGDWVDWTQASATNPASTLQVFASSPPSGMALIPAGSFTMGNCMATNEGSSSELPLHSVYVSAFYMDKYEVTKALWDGVYQWATNHGYTFTSAGSGKVANHPVHSIYWYDMVKWCNARSQKEGLAPCYYTSAAQTTLYQTGDLNLTNACVNWTANGYRLPTEAEWEKAARGGTPGHRFPWSNVDTISHSQANYQAGSSYSYNLSYPATYHPTFATGGTPYTSPVGYFAPNGYGLHDMAGNVWERCWDWYAGTYYSSSPSNNPQGPSGALSNRVLRGGAYAYFAYDARCANRYYHTPATAGNVFGFRCVRVL